MGQLEIAMRPRNDPRPDSERLLEFLGVELEVEPILVGDAQPVARKATVGDDVSEELVEGHALIDPQSAGVLDIPELAGNAELRRQPPHDPGAERTTERSRLEYVAQMRSRHAHAFGELFVGQSRTLVRGAQERLAGCRDLDEVVVELEYRLVFVV